MTTALLRPCMWGLAFAGLMMTTTPVAAELPVVVMYDQSEVVALASPRTDREPVRVDLSRQQPERVADVDIHQP